MRELLNDVSTNIQLGTKEGCTNEKTAFLAMQVRMGRQVQFTSAVFTSRRTCNVLCRFTAGKTDQVHTSLRPIGKLVEVLIAKVDNNQGRFAVLC